MGVLNAASVVIPNRVLAGVRVEGPDEDTFTLVVRAAKLLGRAEVTSGGPVGVPRRIHILSTLPEAWANLLRETGAFGTGQTALRDSGSGIAQGVERRVLIPALCASHAWSP